MATLKVMVQRNVTLSSMGSSRQLYRRNGTAVQGLIRRRTRLTLDALTNPEARLKLRVIQAQLQSLKLGARPKAAVAKPAHAKDKQREDASAYAARVQQQQQQERLHEQQQARQQKQQQQERLHEQQQELQQRRRQQRRQRQRKGRKTRQLHKRQQQQMEERLLKLGERLVMLETARLQRREDHKQLERGRDLQQLPQLQPVVLPRPTCPASQQQQQQPPATHIQQQQRQSPPHQPSGREGTAQTGVSVPTAHPRRVPTGVPTAIRGQTAAKDPSKGRQTHASTTKVRPCEHQPPDPNPKAAPGGDREGQDMETDRGQGTEGGNGSLAGGVSKQPIGDTSVVTMKLNSWLKVKGGFLAGHLRRVILPLNYAEAMAWEFASFHYRRLYQKRISPTHYPKPDQAFFLRCIHVVAGSSPRLLDASLRASAKLFEEHRPRSGVARPHLDKLGVGRVVTLLARRMENVASTHLWSNLQGRIRRYMHHCRPGHDQHIDRIIRAVVTQPTLPLPSIFGPLATTGVQHRVGQVQSSLISNTTNALHVMFAGFRLGLSTFHPKKI